MFRSFVDPTITLAACLGACAHHRAPPAASADQAFFAALRTANDAPFDPRFRAYEPRPAPPPRVVSCADVRPMQHANASASSSDLDVEWFFRRFRPSIPRMAACDNASSSLGRVDLVLTLVPPGAVANVVFQRPDLSEPFRTCVARAVCGLDFRPFDSIVQISVPLNFASQP